MVSPVSIVVPTYKRLDNIRKTYDDLKDLGCPIYFVCHESDTESQELVKTLPVEMIIDTQKPSGVNATNAGYWGSKGEWVVIGQDDFKWHKGWLESVLLTRDHYGAEVIGLNDGYAGRTEHSVGWLVHRPYVEENSLSIGHPNVIFNPDYTKNFSDNELNDTAKYRGVWAYSYDALCEHMHPTFGKAESDLVYTELDKAFQQDMELYESRKHLFGL